MRDDDSFWLEFADGINEFGDQASHEHGDPHEQDGEDPDDQDEEDDSQELLDGDRLRVKEDCVYRRGEMHQHCCRCRVHSSAIPMLIIHTLNQFSLNPSINTNSLSSNVADSSQVNIIGIFVHHQT